MNELIEKVKEYVINKSNEYKDSSLDHYDFWNEHIKYVYNEAINLANKYNADIDTVKLGALLHDIALIEKVGERKDHHLNGKILSDKILDEFNCPESIKSRVLGCVFNHRSSKNATKKVKFSKKILDITFKSQLRRINLFFFFNCTINFTYAIKLSCKH